MAGVSQLVARPASTVGLDRPRSRLRLGSRWRANAKNRGNGNASFGVRPLRCMFAIAGPEGSAKLNPSRYARASIKSASSKAGSHAEAIVIHQDRGQVRRHAERVGWPGWSLHTGRFAWDGSSEHVWRMDSSARRRSITVLHRGVPRNAVCNPFAANWAYVDCTDCLARRVPLSRRDSASSNAGSYCRVSMIGRSLKSGCLRLVSRTRSCISSTTSPGLRGGSWTL